MTFTVQEPNVCRRVMEIIQFGKFAKKSEKTSGENVDNICGTLKKIRQKRLKTLETQEKPWRRCPSISHSVSLAQQKLVCWKIWEKFTLEDQRPEPTNHPFFQRKMTWTTPPWGHGFLLPRRKASKEDSMLRGLSPSSPSRFFWGQKNGGWGCIQGAKWTSRYGFEFIHERIAGRLFFLDMEIGWIDLIGLILLYLPWFDLTWFDVRANIFYFIPRCHNQQMELL